MNYAHFSRNFLEVDRVRDPERRQRLAAIDRTIQEYVEWTQIHEIDPHRLTDGRPVPPRYQRGALTYLEYLLRDALWFVKELRQDRGVPLPRERRATEPRSEHTTAPGAS